MSDSSAFRSWLKRRRTERGLTQEALGERVGYAAQTIRKIEGGQRRPSLQLALRLAQVLELGPEEQAAWMNAARTVAEPDEAAPAPQNPRPPTPLPSLPTYLTPFVGRAQEQAELASLLGRADCRLVTVLGPGGVGKTRLAVETGRTIGDFADGTVFVSLAPVAGPPMHVHFQQEEGLTVVAGRLGYQVQGEPPRYAEVGESVVFARGVAHRFWADGDQPLRAKGYVQPAHNIVYFLSEIYRSTRANGGRPNSFDAAFLVHKYRSEFAMLDIPVVVTRLIFPILRLVGNVTGRFKQFTQGPAPLP